MEHRDHVSLLEDGIPVPGGIWADFGSGTGAFTLALADLVGPHAMIYSIDLDHQALSTQEIAFRRHFGGKDVPSLSFIQADFTRSIELPSLDGLVMANALHFHKDIVPILKLLVHYLKPSGRMLLVEYNLHQGNPWVPFPVPYSTWQTLAKDAGFTKTSLLKRRPSRTMREIYSAVSIK